MACVGELIVLNKIYALHVACVAQTSLIIEVSRQDSSIQWGGVLNLRVRAESNLELIGTCIICGLSFCLCVLRGKMVWRFEVIVFVLKEAQSII